MTKYIDLTEMKPQEKKITLFTHVLCYDWTWDMTDESPEDYENIEYLGVYDGEDSIFKAYDDDKREYVIYRGIKGDEF